jgi:ABC-type branched-subunit amino acid transport system permease subunit
MSPRILCLPAFILFLLVAPQLVSEFHVTLLNYIGLYSIVAIGLVLLTGVGGLMSFGQAAFVGLGGYATAYLSTSSSLPAWIAFPRRIALAGARSRVIVLTAVVALLLGLLTLRLSGHYLPLGTIAWSISLYFLFGNLEFLGGHTGIAGIPALSMSWPANEGCEKLLLSDLGWSFFLPPG